MILIPRMTHVTHVQLTTAISFTVKINSPDDKKYEDCECVG
jgi:hypothetical protein